MSTVFLTVISGVTVFVIGQLIMKFYIDPIVRFKESIGRIIHFFLTNRAIITNTYATLEQQAELKSLGGDLLASKQAIAHYCLLCRLFGLPTEGNVLEACQIINQVSHNMVKDTSPKNGNVENSIENQRAISRLAETLGVKLDFTR